MTELTNGPPENEGGAPKDPDDVKGLRHPTTNIESTCRWAPRPQEAHADLGIVEDAHAFGGDGA